MADPTLPRSSPAERARLIGAAGWLIILLAAGAALLPVVDRLSGYLVAGAMLIVAGLIEIYAGRLRHEVRTLAMLAGAVTTLAGLLFVLNPVAHFSPTVTIVTGWLLVRSIILLITSQRSHGSVKMWITLSAAMDFVLAAVLLVGLSVSSLVIALFGPTPTLVASFAWVFALSFVVTGTLLLEVASCERESADTSATG